jgi:hypothetical protein
MKIIAWYLPQFHEIPENNMWWGKGFTEWDNVRKAVVCNPGQIQPRVPLNGNYYDLTDDAVKKWQVELAKKYGIYGFCMYHYWFDGKLLLEKPTEQYLANKELDLPFCLCWANEHWTNRWLSGRETILIEQRYGDEKQWTEHFNYLLPFLKDDRYIRTDGKPLLIIFRPELIGCVDGMLACWQSLAKKNGLPGISMAYSGMRWDYSDKVKDGSFDYNVEMQPGLFYSGLSLKNMGPLFDIREKIPDGLVRLFSKPLDLLRRLYSERVEKNGAAFSYDEVWEEILAKPPKSAKNIPGAFAQWDNSPRKHENGYYFTGVSPEKFELYLERLIIRARDVYKKDMLFLFAWNEWAEGAYLEPDELYGYGFLEAVRNALERTGELP